MIDTRKHTIEFRRDEIMAEKRKDKARTVLKTGEVQRKNGTYQYSWMDGQLKRRFILSPKP